MDTHNPAACLLIHGFTGSPSEMEDLGRYLAARGCVVRLPVLPGHGSTPEALLAVRAQDWLFTVEREYRLMAGNSHPVFAIGLSMGAALALHLAANFPLAGVVALAPAMYLPLWQRAAAYALHRVVRWRRKADGPDVHDQSARHRLASYDRYPTAAVLELVRTMQVARTELPRVTVPLLIMHGRLDRTTSFKNVEILRRGVRSSEIQTATLDHSAHVVTVDRDQEKVFTAVWDFVRRHCCSQSGGLPEPVGAQ